MQLSCLRLEAQELRAEHRDQGERTDGRNDHDDTCDPSQLLEHESGQTLYHGKREEHGKHGQGRSNNGDTHLLGRMDSSLLRFRTSFKVSRNVLQNHDGIIHHHTDRN